MFETAFSHLLIVTIFFIGYGAIIFEHTIKVNKAASALIMAIFTWTLLSFTKGESLTQYSQALHDHLSDVSQIIFFLLSALTIVELIDSHKGFKVLTDLIYTNSKKKLLWIIGLITFFLSAVLDNLTTAVVMITLLRKLIPEPHERLLLGSMIVVAANAGGAWSPIGDLTTTMLWIQGAISSWGVIKALFFPSLFSLFIALLLIGRSLRGKYKELLKAANEESVEPGGRLIFYLSLFGFLFVPVFKMVTGLPPFMGMLLLLGILWLTTDLIHHKIQHRQHLLLHHILTRIDTSGVLFFFGILLCIGALDAIGILRDFSEWLNQLVNHQLGLIAFFIGILSAVVDNVPLIAATLSMYDLSVYPSDSSLWQMLAYAAGTGGSMLLIGSAAGVALMGMEKVGFFWYCKHVSWIAFLSYLGGLLFYFIFS